MGKGINCITAYTKWNSMLFVQKHYILYQKWKTCTIVCKRWDIYKLLLVIFLLCFIQIKQKLILLCNIQKQPHHTFKEKKLETYNRRTLHYGDRWKCILLALTVKLITCDWLVPLLRNPLEWHNRTSVKMRLYMLWEEFITRQDMSKNFVISLKK